MGQKPRGGRDAESVPKGTRGSRFMRRRTFWTPLSLWNCSSSSKDEGSGRPETGLDILLVDMWVDIDGPRSGCGVVIEGGQEEEYPFVVIGYDDIDFFLPKLGTELVPCGGGGPWITLQVEIAWVQTHVLCTLYLPVVTPKRNVQVQCKLFRDRSHDSLNKIITFFFLVFRPSTI